MLADSPAVAWTVRLFRYRLMRFFMSSGLSAAVGAVVLVGGYAVMGWPAWVCSLVSFLAAGLVSYLLYRRWTFQNRDRTRLVREVVPFLGLSAATLLLATGGAQAGQFLATRLTPDRSVQGFVVLGAVLACSVAAIPVRYLACRWIFTGTRGSCPVVAPEEGHG